MTPKTTLQALPPTFRMTMQDYRKMEKDLPNARVSREDTPEIVAQKLGVQLALQYIRDNFLVT